jgi:hypothetical protein
VGGGVYNGGAAIDLSGALNAARLSGTAVFTARTGAGTTSTDSGTFAANRQ